MIEIRDFIKNLGDQAPAYFGASQSTITRWIKTGNVPIKQAQKIFAAQEALTKMQQPPPTVNPTPTVPSPPPTPADPVLDPMTKLPVNLERRLPNVSGVMGRPPDVIEMSPAEQSFGVNFTRPGRVNQGPTPPMKLKEVDGQKVAFQENTPALADQKNPDGSPRLTLPPSIPGDTSWAQRAPDEPKPETTAPEGVS